MSMNLALQSALSGLTTSQQQAALTSRNIANANVEGYTRKDLIVTSRVINGQGVGVKVEGISRQATEYLIRDIRNLNAQNNAYAAKGEALTSFTDIVGQPQDERSISSSLARFTQTFQQLRELPDSDPAQRAVVAAAEELAANLASADRAIKNTREDADRRIATSVETVNGALSRLEVINKQITQNVGSAQDLTDIYDERDRLVDQISAEIGIRTYMRDNDDLVITTQGGTTLLDGKARKLEFTPTGTITAAMSYTPGGPGLSGLSVDGVDIAPGGGYAGSVTTGRIAGLFSVRDDLMVKFQVQIDEISSHLMDQFQSKDISVTGTAPEDTGLFTENGASHDRSGPWLPGLAGRIQVNDAVKVEKGGQAWRVRDGIHAATPGETGSVTQVDGFLSVFDTNLNFSAAGGLATTSKIGAFATNAVGNQHFERSLAQDEAKAKSTLLESMSLSRKNLDGVNTDEQLQKLLNIEQAYAASAQVIQAVTKMIEQLLRIGG